MAIEVNPATVVQWGRVVFHLDNVAFCKGFLHSREYYQIDATIEEPQRTSKLTVEEVLQQIAVLVKEGFLNSNYGGVRALSLGY